MASPRGRAESKQLCSRNLLGLMGPVHLLGSFLLGVDLGLDPPGLLLVCRFRSPSQKAWLSLQDVSVGCSSLSRESWRVPWFSLAPPHFRSSLLAQILFVERCSHAARGLSGSWHTWSLESAFEVSESEEESVWGDSLGVCKKKKL